MIERILVAYDESPQAESALKVAIDLSRALGAYLKVVTVAEPLPTYLSLRPPRDSHWTAKMNNKPGVQCFSATHAASCPGPACIPTQS